MATKIKAEEIGTQRKSGAVADRIEKQRANMDYLRNHYEKLLKKYPNHWVIVSGGKVVDAESTASRLVKSISKTKTNDKLLYYLASPKKRMFL